MEVMYRDQPADTAARRPSWLDLCAAGLLAAAVVLHLVAMFPLYFGGRLGQGSVWSQPDQAALYAVVTAGWALALALVLLGPVWIRLGAGIAVGLAITELGFRVGDVGEALHYGVGGSSTGVWLMTAGWVTGAAGAIVAVLAVLAVRRRAQAELVDAPATDPTPAWDPAPVVVAPIVMTGLEPSDSSAAALELGAAARPPMGGAGDAATTGRSGLGRPGGAPATSRSALGRAGGVPAAVRSRLGRTGIAPAARSALGRPAAARATARP